MQDTLDLLEHLIQFDSSSQHTANETIDYCADWLQKEGLASEIINNGYKMLVCNVGEGNKKLVLNGHVDVVSGKSTNSTRRQDLWARFGRYESRRRFIYGSDA